MKRIILRAIILFYEFLCKKILYKNELGWRSGLPNTLEISIVSKKAAEYFPPHDPDEIDPSMSLGIIVNDMKHLVNAEYAHDNDPKSKHRGKDRRIYLNEEIDPKGSYFQPGYYIVFFKYFDDKDQEIKYILYRFTPEDKEYEKLEKSLNKRNA